MLTSPEPSRQRKRGEHHHDDDAATTAPKSSAHHKNHRKKKITNANTDRLCLDDSSGFLGRLWYHVSLHNGLYMLDPAEKVALNAAGALFTVLTILYLWSFGKGFVDGFLGAELQQQHHHAAVSFLVDQGGSGGGGGSSGENYYLSHFGDAAAAAGNGAVSPLSPAPVVLEALESSSSYATGGAPSEL